jgi:hypothetical protein
VNAASVPQTTKALFFQSFSKSMQLLYLLKTQKDLSSTLLREDLLLEPPRPGVILTKKLHVLSIQDEKIIS